MKMCHRNSDSNIISYYDSLAPHKPAKVLRQENESVDHQICCPQCEDKNININIFPSFHPDNNLSYLSLTIIQDKWSLQGEHGNISGDHLFILKHHFSLSHSCSSSS
jgi:hypothetical protein